MGTSHSTPSMSAPTSTGTGTVWGEASPGSSFLGQGVVGVVAVPAWTRPPAQHETMDPAVPSTTVSAWFRCQLPIGSRRTPWMRLPGPIVRATQPTTCFGSSSAGGSALLLTVCRLG